MPMQSNGVGTVLSTESPSAKSYMLVNPNDLSQNPNNVDLVPSGTGPSNLSSGGAADPYWVTIPASS